MSLDLLSTLAAVGTFFVIAAMAAAAVIQLRHLRASNQLTAFMTITQNFDHASFRELPAYIQNDLAEPRASNRPELDSFRRDRAADKALRRANRINRFPWLLHIPSLYFTPGSTPDILVHG